MKIDQKFSLRPVRERLKSLGKTQIHLGGWRFLGSAAMLAGAIGGVALLLGLVLGVNNKFPAPLISKIQQRLTAPPAQAENASVWTQYMPLNVQQTQLPKGRENSSGGGGLTEFGPDSLLLTFDGRFFAIDADGKADLVSLAPPDNGYKDFVAFSERPENQARDFLTQHHRYNDVLLFEADGKRQLAISYSEFHSEEACISNTVALMDVPTELSDARALSGSADDWRVLYRTSPCLKMSKEPYWPIFGQMGGGRMLYHDGELVFTSGDFHRDGVYAEEIVSQDPDAEYGKVIGINTQTGEHRTISTGHRNVQGITVDGDGNIWVTEHGPNGGDELNLVREGNNYGWPYESYGNLYNRAPWPNQVEYVRHDTYDAPVYAWVPSIGISTVSYLENFSPSWDGDLIVAALKDARLYRLRFRGDRVEVVEPIWVNGQRIRYVLAHSDGRLVVWTDDEVIATVTAKSDTHTSDSMTEYVEALELPTTRETRLTNIIDSCQMCHAFNPNDNASAPSLAGIFGRDIATTEYANYSNVLASMRGEWNRERLTEYLSDPSGFAPGTTMPATGLDDPQEVEDLIDFLALRNVPGKAMLAEGKRQIELDKENGR